MRVILLSAAFLLFTNTVFSQARKTNGVSEPASTINFSDPGITDYEVNLLQLDQYPLPASEFSNLKEELNKLRTIHKQTLPAIKQRNTSRGSAINPVVTKGAQGNTANGVPNDNDIAVSNDGKVVSVVNSNMRIFDDTLKILQSKSLTSLVSSIGTFSWISDPRVLYDPSQDRFVLVCFTGSLSQDSKIIVGFTQTPDPMGTWNFYTLNGNSFNDSTWSDYPIIALSDKDLFMTFNQVKDNVSWTVGFKQSVIWQINKQDGYNNVPLNYTLWDSIQYNGINLRNICPAKYQSPTMGNKMYFLTLRNVAASNDSLFLTEISDSYISGNAQLSIQLLNTPITYGFPPNAVQKLYTTGPQQYLMTNDARVLAAIYENDYIHFGSNSLNPAHMNAGIMLGQIKNVSTTTPTVTAQLFSRDTLELGYPSMAYMGTSPSDHRVLYTFSHCYVDSFPGTSMMYKDASDNYSDIISVKDGISYINVLSDSNERWGDYTNIQRKYNTPNTAYLSGSWGKSVGMNCWVAKVENMEAVVGLHDAEQVSSTVELFPNPAHERFTIRFDLDDSKKVRFELFDMQGRLVALLLDTQIKKGTNEFSFSTTPLSKGTYLLKLSSNGNQFATHTLSVR